MNYPPMLYQMRPKFCSYWHDYSPAEWDLVVIPFPECKCEDPYRKDINGLPYCARCGGTWRDEK